MTVAAGFVLASPLAVAQTAVDRSPWYVPDRAWIQAGRTEVDVHSLAVGGDWTWRWQRALFAGGTIGGHTELALGYWDADGPGDRASVRIGLTPVLRASWPAGTASLFVEAGIGANLIAPRYKSGWREFGSTFNFGDHVGLGLRFGGKSRHELSLRYQHFSNAGLRDPNPGEDFVQLRYAISFD